MMAARRANATTQYIKTRDYNERLEQRRVREAYDDNLRQYHITNTRWTANHQSDTRVENKRRQQRVRQQNEELATINGYMEQVREKEQKALLRQQDEALAAALYDVKSQRVAEETNARRICEESEELKELKEKLRAAKISKVRATQLEERNLVEKQRATHDRAMDVMMENDRQAALDREYEESQRKFFLNLQSRSVLQNQIAERQQRKREAYEAFLTEKAMVDEIVRGIEEEDREKMVAQQRKQQELQENIRIYLEERRMWREAERQRAEEELRKIQEYNALQLKRQDELRANKKAKQDREDAALRQVTKEIEAKRREEEEMRALLDELYMEEAEQKALEKMREERAKRERMKNEMLRANEAQKQLKAERAAQLQAEEEEFREQMFAKFAEDKRLEQMNDARRRREMQNYKNEVERLIEERRQMYQASVEAELAERKQKEEQEKYRLAVVERERQRLLRENAEDLKDYLPKGVLKDARDFEVVYGRAPKPSDDDDTIAYIAARNGGLGSKTSVGSSSSMNSRPPSKIGRGGDAGFGVSGSSIAGGSRRQSNRSQGPTWWGDGSDEPQQQHRGPSAGRRSRTGIY